MAGILLNRSRQVPAEETPAFGGIAERFRRAGDLDRAIALCRDGLKRFPEQLSARVTLGWALLDKGQYDLARGELEQVLRKAPDNLAAIRGLAELHDRTEGALAAEDERAWKSEEVSTAAMSTADVRLRPSEGTASDAALDDASEAPIQVPLGQGAPEGLHAAAASQAEFNPGTVELEDPMTATMAAAEPTPFFVVDPDDSSGEREEADGVELAPVPFDVSGLEETHQPVEIETASSAALSGLDQSVELSEAPAPAEPADIDGHSEPVHGFDFDVLPQEADFSGVDGDAAESWNDYETPAAVALAAPLSTDSLDDWAALADSTMPDVPVDTPVWDMAPGEAGPAVFEASAGADLESGLDALLNLTTDTPDQVIGGDITELHSAPELLDDVDALAGQDLADAIRALEDAARRVEARFAVPPSPDAPSATADEIAGYDFGSASGGASSDAPAESSSSVVNARHDAAFELVAPDLADLSFEADDRVEAAEEQGVVANMLDLAAPSLDFEAGLDAPASDTESEPEGMAPASVVPEVSGSIESQLEAAELNRERDLERDADGGWPDETLPHAAMVATRLPLPAFPYIEQEIAGIAGAAVPSALLIPGQVRVPPRTALAGLERFLRQVQARQLELRSHTVA